MTHRSIYVLGCWVVMFALTPNGHCQFFTESFNATDGAFPNPNTNYPANAFAEPAVWGLQVEVQDLAPQGFPRGMTFWGPYYPGPGDQFPPTFMNNDSTFYNQMDTQWFFFRVGGQQQEFPLDHLGLNPPWSPLDAFPNNPISLHYGSAADPFEVDVNYTLTATSIASSTIHESVTLTNNMPFPLDLDWFELTDFSLDGQNINLGSRSGGQTNYTQGGFLPGTLATVDVVSGPVPNHWEISDSGTLEASLRDGGVTSLSDSDNVVGLFPRVHSHSVSA